MRIRFSQGDFSNPSFRQGLGPRTRNCWPTSSICGEGGFFRGNFFPIVGVPLLNVNSHFFLQRCSLYKSVVSKLEITTWLLHLDGVVNKVRVVELFVLYIYLPFFIGWFTTYLNLVRTRLVWVVLCQGYTGRPNRVGIRPDVAHRTSGVHCTIKYIGISRNWWYFPHKYSSYLN